MGAEGKLHCLDLASGKVIWKRDLRADYNVPQDFFGTASTPLVEGRLLIVNVGAPGGPCVVALDTATGKEVWRAGKDGDRATRHRCPRSCTASVACSCSRAASPIRRPAA